MGSMLVRKFVEAGVVLPDSVFAYNHTPEKLTKLVNDTGINASKNNFDVVERSDIIFICVRPYEVKNLIRDIKPHLTEKKVIVSVASDISLKNLSEWSGINVVRVIPSITSECKSGISIVSFGENISLAVKKEILMLFSSISRPYVTAEDNMSLLSDLTSSSPAIISSIIHEYAMAAVRTGKLTENDAEFLLRETFIGTAGLFSENGYNFKSLISAVSTKGGITAEGVGVVEDKASFLFDTILAKMSEKHVLVSKDINH